MAEQKPLTVADLLEQLAPLPPHAEVWIDDSTRRFAAPVVGSLSLGDVDGRVYLFPAGE